MFVGVFFVWLKFIVFDWISWPLHEQVLASYQESFQNVQYENMKKYRRLKRYLEASFEGQSRPITKE